MTARTFSASKFALRQVISRISVGTLEVRWSDDTEQVFASTSGGLPARIEIWNETHLLKALVDGGALGLGAAYLDSAWDTPDLAGFLELASTNVDVTQSTRFGSRLTASARSFWDRRPSYARSHTIGEIGDHYDLGNDFYAAWLDSTMSYSSALFASPDQTLEEAQEAKYRKLCEMLDLQQGDRVLEIGCGWGGFMEYASRHYDVHVTGLTLSDEMATFARKRLADAGLADRTDVKLLDFRHERAMYDKVVSIEMIESVDEAQWAPLFHAIARAIPPGGRAAMQAITIDPRYYDNLLVREDFIKRYIFPGGALPTADVLERLTVDAGMEWVDSSTHGADYAETLHRWTERFEMAWDSIAEHDPVFDDRFRRMWRYYLGYCEAGFRTGRLDGIQVLMERPT